MREREILCNNKAQNQLCLLETQEGEKQMFQGGGVKLENL